MFKAFSFHQCHLEVAAIAHIIGLPNLENRHFLEANFSLQKLKARAIFNIKITQISRKIVGGRISKLGH